MKKYATALLALSLWATQPQAEPFQSPATHQTPMWDYFHQRLLDKQNFVFDDSIHISTPPFAEDARQVPVEVDGRSLQGQVSKIMLWAELNPIPVILSVTPSEQLDNFLAVRIRVEQATPIRAAFLMDDGLWHVGTGHIEATGGGCSAPSVTRAQEGWEKSLGQILGARYSRGNSDHLRLRIAHPMDNGLMAGEAPEFYLDHAQLRDADGKVLADLELFPSLSENPTLTLAVKGSPHTRLWFRDNNGNEFSREL